MTFEEQFPSLNKAINNVDFANADFSVVFKLLSDACLDKQKVREIIRHLEIRITQDSSFEGREEYIKGYQECINYLNHFLKELGL